MSEALEEHLTQDVQKEREHLEAVRDRLKELQALSDRAEDGDEDAKVELRRVLKKSGPEVIARCSNIARNYRRMPAGIAYGGAPLMKEAIVERAERMAGEIACEHPTPPESLVEVPIASLRVL